MINYCFITLHCFNSISFLQACDFFDRTPSRYQVIMFKWRTFIGEYLNEIMIVSQLGHPESHKLCTVSMVRDREKNRENVFISYYLIILLFWYKKQKQAKDILGQPVSFDDMRGDIVATTLPSKLRVN